MIRILMGITLAASATSGLGLQIVMGAIGLGLMAWGFYSMYINGQLEDV
jgi:hypothetical protein